MRRSKAVCLDVEVGDVEFLGRVRPSEVLGLGTVHSGIAVDSCTLYPFFIDILESS
jgi:hypothetical protein